MPDAAAIETFIDGYRRTFASFDADAITGLFAFPCQVVSQGAAATTVAAVPDAAAWRTQVERIVGAYRALGVVTAEILDLRAVEVMSGAGHAVVHWGLTRADASRVYDFTAAYTLADLGDGLRITAIVHDETPKLMAALGARAAG